MAMEKLAASEKEIARVVTENTSLRDELKKLQEENKAQMAKIAQLDEKLTLCQAAVVRLVDSYESDPGAGALVNAMKNTFKYKLPPPPASGGGA